MRTILIILFLSASIAVQSKVIDVQRLTDIADSEFIALVEVVAISESTFDVRILENIRGTRNHQVYQIRKSQFEDRPYIRYSDYAIGQKEVIFFVRLKEFELRTFRSESELLFKNDSVFIRPNAFQHGCYNLKYREKSPFQNGIKMDGFPIDDFAEAIREMDKKYDLFRKLISEEKAVQNEKQAHLGYDPNTGQVPELSHRKLIAFRSKSSFHEYLLDLLMDEVLTTYQ